MTKYARKKYYQDKELLKKIGGKIRDARIKQNLSIQAFCKANGLEYSQVARMERGEVNFTICYLFRIAEALGIATKQLVS